MSLDRTVVERALHQVFDPCSITAQSPVSVLDMGMVTGLEIDGNKVHLKLRPTNLGCTLIPTIMIDIEEKLAAEPAVGDVSISIDTESTWSPDEMSERGRDMLARRRAAAQARMPVQPKQWMLPGQEEARRERLAAKRLVDQSLPAA